MRVLVTGASGFLGAHVAAACAGAGLRPVAAVRAGSDLRRLRALAGEIDTVALDLADPVAARTALERARAAAVVHCAAYGVDYRQQDAAAAIAINVSGTAALIEAAADAGLARFVHVGTCYEYGDVDAPIPEGAPLCPIGLYAASKAAAALIAIDRAAECALALTVLRPGAMYGPHEGAHKLVPQLLRACMEGEPLPLSSGTQCRDYVFVADVADACVRALAAPATASAAVYNLGSGVATTVRELAARVAAVCGADGGRLFRWGARADRSREIRRNILDSARARADLGWAASTPIEAGVARMLAAHGAQRCEDVS
ncbi:MAG: NAD-dependent epimerase/dehydratase family protein [Gammaproteobacteria bacterium]